MKEIRYDREFGDSTFLGDHGDLFLQKSFEQQAIELGWSHACPVIDEVIVEYGKGWFKKHPHASADEIREAGIHLTRKRYAECNFVGGFIQDEAKKHNSSLYKELTQSRKRLANEPAGHYLKERAPDSHETQMSPLSTPVGYALPRIIIELMGRGENNKDRTPERMLTALILVEEAVKVCTNQIELVIYIAEEAAKRGADATSILTHLLPTGLLQEENCRVMFKDMIKEMRKSAPTICETYDKLHPNKKKSLGIISYKAI